MARVPGSSGDEWRFTGDRCRWNAKVRVAAVAARQRGRIRYDQLRAIGISDRTIGRWRRTGYLHSDLPRVYAVGHPGRSTESDLGAALLYAGPGAMLSHGTALWRLGLLKYPPQHIHVSTPRRVKSLDGILVHGRRPLPRIWRNGLPTTTPSQALLDFAATGQHDLLRLALANADYHDLLDLAKLKRLTGRGIKGSAALNHALQIHLPELAGTRSELERLLLTFCQKHNLPIPETNVYVEGHLVDAYWRQQRVIVEVDGYQGHRTRAQLHHDHQRDLELRAAGYIVLRYTRRQIERHSKEVARDLARYSISPASFERSRSTALV
jgi:very-short-patch-repair endonuclease